MLEYRNTKGEEFMTKLLRTAMAALVLASTAHAIDDPIYIAKKTRAPLAHYGNEDFTVNLAAGVLLDYTRFDQDETNIAQVGKQENQWDLRALRAALFGQFSLFDQKIEYFIACGFSDYLTRDSRKLCSLFDATIAFSLPNDYGKITIGKQKEPWSYEMVGDSASLMQHERYLNPLFQSRSVGIRYNTTYMKKKGTFSIGVYNDWVENNFKFTDSNHQVTSRITYLPYLSEDRMDYVHLGLSGRYNTGNDGKLRYKGKPESNVADNFLDTGDIEADHALEFALEGLVSYHGLSLLGEYIQSDVDSKTAGNPHFDGWYVIGGWMLTGEGRPYDPNVGYARRVIPQGEYGALELIARYGKVDLDDGSVHGGTMTKWMAGANWWIDAYWKASVSYGTARLNRFDTIGKSDIMLFRVQWFR